MLNKLLRRFRPQKPPLPEAAPMPPQPRPIHVTDEDFDTVILGSDKLAVVDFWAEWCEPCHAMAVSMHFLAQDYDGRVVVAKVDVEENPVITERYNLMGIPTVIFFRDGAEIDRHTGILNIEELSQRVEKWMNEE
jgi:thioredoxin 1